MNENTIIALFGLSVVAFVFIFFICLMFRENKTKSKEVKPVEKHTNLLFRVMHTDTGWPCYIDKYYAEIYTILPYEEKVLMTTEQYYFREDATAQAELIIKQLIAHLNGY